MHADPAGDLSPGMSVVAQEFNLDGGYDVEVQRADGSEVDVRLGGGSEVEIELDSNLTVLEVDRD